MEAERERFRTYLENSGLMSALTNALVTLYELPNKPPDALLFITENLQSKTLNENKSNKVYLLEKKCESLEQQVKALKEALAKDTKDEEIESLDAEGE